MENVKVSIITVTFNVVNTIEQTINSVLNQTYDNIEYIMVDGMSTDGTWEKICKYKNRISVLIHEKDNGLYDAMNKGIAQATGDIIGIVNGDDWYERDTLVTIVNNFQDDTDIIYARMNIIGYDGAVQMISLPDKIDDIWYRMIPHPTVFVRKCIYDKYGTFNLNYPIVADYEMIFRFYLAGVKFKYIDKVLTNFRRGGLTTKRQIECVEEVKKVSLSYIDKCPEPEKYIKLINRAYNSALLKSIYAQEDIIVKEALESEILNDNLCIFGAGKIGQKFVKKINRCGIKIVFIIDNDISKKDTYIDEIKVDTPNILEKWKGSILIAAIDYSDILDQLVKIGNKNMHIIDISKLYKRN
ncbi:MAG: glycosyltransferase [Lachnospiraceae bacterium]|nr:glycosyltransferase [Lachnospiraceae bacterium]